VDLCEAIDQQACHYVGTLWNCYTIIRDGYALGKDVNAFFKKGSQKHKGGSKIPQCSNQGGGGSSGGSNGGGSRQGDGVGAAAAGTVKAVAKVLNDTKEEVEFIYDKGEITGQIIRRGGEVVQQVGRITQDQIKHFAEWRQEYSKVLRHVVDDCYEVIGKIPGLPDNVKFISQNRLHKGEIEVFVTRTKHIGAWVADKALTVLRWVKEAEATRKAFGK
jgi:hypothetical protein